MTPTPFLAALLLACMLGPATAQTATPPPASPPPGAAENPAPTGRASEPNVRHIIIEDDLSRIEELRVRGLTRRISVQPKGGQAAYEIVPTDPGSETPNTGRPPAGAGGQRVWPVLRF
jgi:hypothetical protein